MAVMNFLWCVFAALGFASCEAMNKSLDSRNKMELEDWQDDQNIKRPQRGILMFLDESENRMEAVGGALFSALEQKAAPILASGCLLKNFLKAIDENDKKLASGVLRANPYSKFIDSMKSKNGATLPMEEVMKNIEHMVLEANTGSAEKISNERWDFLLTSRKNDFKDWLIFDVNGTSSLYLLIPQSYLKQIMPNFTHYSSGSIDSLSLSTGFKLAKMHYVDTHILPALQYKDCAKALKTDSIVKLLSGIFLTNKDYAQHASGANPSWTIYMIGHGSPGASVVGMPLKIFPQLLDFFENKISVRLFVYNSCYSAGENAEKIYNDIRSSGAYKKTYSYPVISGALTDAPTALVVPSILLSGALSGDNFINHDAHYDEFMLRATQAQDPLDFAYIISPIIPLLENSIKNAGAQKSAAQIRLPGMPWFSVIDAQNRAISIGALMAATRTEPLKIKKFYDKQRELSPDELETTHKSRSKGLKRSARKSSERHRGNIADAGPIAILLYTTRVPFEIEMSGLKKMPYFVSMVPGNAFHYFRKIIARDVSLGDLLPYFEADPDVQKVFFIETLEIASFENIGPVKHPHITLKNIQIKDRVALFEYRDAILGYKGHGLIEPARISRKQREEYDHLLKAFTNQVIFEAVTPQVGPILSSRYSDLVAIAKQLADLQRKHPEKAQEKDELLRRNAQEQKVIDKDLRQLFFQLNSLNFALS